jgi:hypothetical protein
MARAQSLGNKGQKAGSIAHNGFAASAGFRADAAGERNFPVNRSARSRKLTLRSKKFFFAAIRDFSNPVAQASNLQTNESGGLGGRKFESFRVRATFGIGCWRRRNSAILPTQAMELHPLTACLTPQRIALKVVQLAP